MSAFAQWLRRYPVLFDLLNQLNRRWRHTSPIYSELIKHLPVGSEGRRIFAIGGIDAVSKGYRIEGDGLLHRLHGKTANLHAAFCFLLQRGADSRKRKKMLKIFECIFVPGKLKFKRCQRVKIIREKIRVYSNCLPVFVYGKLILLQRAVNICKQNTGLNETGIGSNSF